MFRDIHIYYLDNMYSKMILGHIPRGKGYSDYEKLSHKRIAFSLWHLSLSSYNI